ncbi:MAG: polysaccharide biosynthesis tyrosine autokinase, partial [Actinomycetota bacterium]
ADLPSSPASPNYLLNAALALFVGLALGVGLAFLRERLDDRLRGRDDLEARSGAPVFAVVPRVGGWKKRSESRLVTLTEPRSAPTEAYRTLRTGLLFAASQRDMRTVLITSPQVEEGKSTTAANLSVVLAQAGKRVILIDADLRKPRLHRFFQAPNEVGLTSVLSGQVQPHDGLAQPQVPNLRVLTSGPVPGNPAELLSSDQMGSLVKTLREAADLVIMDSPPVLVAADATILASFADGLVLVADADNTTRGTVAHARQQLDQVNARVVASVLNNFDPSKALKYPYYYQYYYTSHYGEGGDGSPRAQRAEGSMWSR